MHCKVRMLFTLGCVSLLAMSVPAFGQPKPGEAKAKSAVQRAAEAKAKSKAKLNAARRDNAPRLVSMPVTQGSARPAFGWPVLVSEARKYMGTNPTDRTRLWCATFMNMVLAKAGYTGTNSDAAKSFAQYGRRISEPRIGAIAVLTRGKRGGHVGVVSGIDPAGNPIIISGNHNKRVGESVYPRARVIAYVMPSENRGGTTQVADRGVAGKSADGGLESPITELLAAIEAEQARPESSRQDAGRQAFARQEPVRQVRPQPPAVPHIAVQQTAEPVSGAGRRELPLDPDLAEFLGIKQRGQNAQRAAPQPQPQRERRVEQQSSVRVAVDTGLANLLLPVSR
jgi:uncharacterized protein (TIGR02594 family)